MIRDELRRTDGGWSGWLLAPLRYLLLRLLNPMLEKEEEVLRRLEKDVEQLRREQRQLAEMLEAAGR